MAEALRLITMTTHSRFQEKMALASEASALRQEVRRLKHEHSAVVAECDQLRASRDANHAMLAAITEGAATFGYAKPGVPLPGEMMPGAMAVSAGVCSALQSLPISAGLLPGSRGAGHYGASKAAGLTGTARLAASIRVPSKDDPPDEIFPG